MLLLNAVADFLRVVDKQFDCPGTYIHDSSTSGQLSDTSIHKLCQVESLGSCGHTCFLEDATARISAHCRRHFLCVLT